MGSRKVGAMRKLHGNAGMFFYERFKHVRILHGSSPQWIRMR